MANAKKKPVKKPSKKNSDAAAIAKKMKAKEADDGCVFC